VRLGVQALLATVIISSAIVAGLGQLALPWISAHPERVSTYLSERLQRPVRIELVDAHWERNGPLFTLRGVHIGEDTAAAPALVISQAGLKINFFSWLQRTTRWNEFLIDGLDLDLARDAEGHWQLRGLSSGDGAPGDNQRALLDLGALTLRHITLRLDDAPNGRQFRFGSDEVRLFNSGNLHRVAARVRSLQAESSPVDTVIEYHSDDDTGTAYVGGAQLDLASILHAYPLLGATVARGSGRAQIWANWHADELTRVQAEFGLTDVLLDARTPVELDEKNRIAPRVSFDRIDFGARWLRGENGWSADLADVRIVRQGAAYAPATVHLEQQNRGPEVDPVYSLQLRDIDLSASANVAMLAEPVPMAVRRWLYAGNPEGTIGRLDLRGSGAGDFDFSASVDSAGWHALGNVPGVVGLNCLLRGDQDAISAELPPHDALSIEAQRVFRRSLDFSEFAGTLAAYRVDTAWRVETGSLLFEGEGYGGELRAALDFPEGGGRPRIDASALVEHAEVMASHLFWPINTMPPPVVTWLDRALASGAVLNGRAVIHGDLADWPFRNYGGRFEAHADIDNMLLKYLPDWPAAEHLRLSANFINTALHVEMESGQDLGARLTHATADIADLGEPLLDLQAGADGTGRDLLALLKATPIGQRFGVQLLGVDIGGQAKVDFHLRVPLKHAEQLALAGTAVLNDADLADAKYALRLNRANGKLRFSQDGFVADDLAVTVEGQPGTFGLAVGAFAADPHHAVEANLSATLPAGSILAYAPALSGYADHMSGTATWNASFSAGTGDNAPQQLLLTSDLRGQRIDLPAPLNKASEQPLPLRLALGLPFNGGSVDLRLGELMHLHGHLPTAAAPFAARVTFGAADEAVPKSGLAISGKPPALDLTGWLDFATDMPSAGAADANGGGNLLDSIDVQTDSMIATERVFGPARFTLARVADGIDLGLTGAALEGTLHVPGTNLRQHGITAQFARLYWPDAAGDGESDDAPGTENPAAMPPLHIHVADFRLGEKSFGETTVETYPVANGSHFEQVTSHSPNLEVRAHGDWTGRPGSDESKFSIEMSAHNIGNMLDAFGYAGVIDGGATVAHIEGSWPGSPASFALTRLNGTLKASIKKGRIPDADPGKARVLGLFNLAAIPRRLAFDWGDLFKSGFTFDLIEGVFNLKDGDAHTENLEVHSPTADMLLKGRMGLKAKDWDQVIEVTPHVGGTLAVGGALIAGPVGAAAGAMLQGIFKNQINSATRAKYKITGSWDKPSVTVIARDHRAKPTPDAKSGSGSPQTGVQSGGGSG